MIEDNHDCKICNSEKFIEVLNFKKSYFSDGSFINKPLIKQECKVCGTIRTKSLKNLDEFYKNNYVPSRNIDTPVILNNIELNRSLFIYNWINDLISAEKLNKFQSILEIGCGQGFLLKHFSTQNKHGVEPNFDAYKEASKKLNIRNIEYQDIDNNEKYDFILSYCVIEHVENPKYFLEKKFDILDNNGIICIALPIQDKFNYDLFFIDHIHHFSNDNFTKLLKNCGFEIINFELGRDSYSNIGMYICIKKDKDQRYFKYIKNKNLESIGIILNNIDKIIQKYTNKNLYAFGYGEIAKTIIPYTNLDKYILSYIDDFSRGERVMSTDDIKNILDEKYYMNIILLVNPQHIGSVKKLFKDYENINFIDIFESIDTN